MTLNEVINRLKAAASNVPLETEVLRYSDDHDGPRVQVSIETFREMFAGMEVEMQPHHFSMHYSFNACGCKFTAVDGLPDPLTRKVTL